MNSAIRLVFLSFLLIVCITNSFSQKAPIKYGKIDIADLEMSAYDKDTTASALVLADYGTSEFTYSYDKGWQVIFKHHKRIKILKKGGYDFADVSIDYYDPGVGGKEKIMGLKGVTYNLENGKIVKQKLSNNAIFDEAKNKYYQRKKFTLPQVKEGCIIEYSYSVISDYIRFLRGWEFQGTIPVKWSEYIVAIPEFFDYQFLSQGYQPFLVNETKQKTELFEYSWNIDTKAGDLRRDKGTGSLESNTKITRMVSENIPAFRPEPYISSSKNYLSKISFELKSTKYRNQGITIIMGTWEKLNNEFLEHEYFGRKIKGSNYLKKNLEEIINGTENPEEVILKVYGYVKKSTSWNGYNGRYLTDNGFKEVLSSKKGSAADINLLLTTLLVKAGLNAEPVLISTRNNGMLKTQYAISSQFNYVICKVEFDGKMILLDATDPYLPIGVLPERCLNGKGWVISETAPGWVEINANKKAATRVSGTLSLTSDGVFEGELENKYEGYSSRSPRKTYLTKGEEDFLKDTKSESDWEIVNLTIENGKDLSKPFLEKYEVELDSEGESLGDQIYFNPLMGDRLTTNPFKLEVRNYPVDFSTPLEQMFYITYVLPEGYHVEEQPQPLALGLPQNAGKYIYNITVMGNKMTVMSKLNINKTLFLPSEYANIKEFFAQVVAKQNEQIVLKKD